MTDTIFVNVNDQGQDVVVKSGDQVDILEIGVPGEQGNPGANPIWGNITGTISDQMDLQNALNAKQNLIHTGDATDYIRGDLTLGIFSTDVNALIFAQKGVAFGIAPLDINSEIPFIYLPPLTTAEIAENGNLYFTTARARGSVSAGTGIAYNATTGVISSTGGGTIAGTIALNQIARGTAANAIGGSSNATLDSSGNAIFAGAVTGARGAFGNDDGYAGNFGGTGFITASFSGLDDSNNRAALLFKGSNSSGNPQPIFEFGTDLNANGGIDFYAYSSATGQLVLQADPGNDIYFFGHEGVVYLSMDEGSFSGFSNGNIMFADNRGGGGGGTTFNSTLFLVNNPDSNYPSGLLEINTNGGTASLGDIHGDFDGVYLLVDGPDNTITLAAGEVNFNGTAIFNASAIIQSGSLQFAEGANIVFGTATGTKIGISTSEKIGFYNSTPIVQPAATLDLGVVLSNLGLRAVGTAYPITTSGIVSLGAPSTTTSQLNVASAGTGTAYFVNKSAHGAAAGAGIIGASDSGAALSSGDRLGFFLMAGAQDAAHSIYNAAGITAFATQNWSSGASGTQLMLQVTPNGTITRTTALTLDQDSTALFAGNVKLSTLGSGLYIKEGTNATAGLSTLVTGTVVVATTKVTSTCRIIPARETLGGTPGHLSITKVPGVSFTITSSSTLETSTIYWVIVEPA